MKIYNKFVESKKEPQNKSDIWFDGSSWKMYKEGMWRAFTLPLDAAVEINKILQEDKSVLQQELKNYLKIQDSPFEKGGVNNSAVLKGTSNSATNKFATAFGEQTTASADRAFSEGLKTTASGTNSHAEGLSTVAQGQNSHAEGNKCKAIGNHSHAEGNDTVANGGASHAEGSGTITKNSFEHAEGRYNFSNKEDSSNNFGGYNTIHSVGIGNSNNNRKNAHEILQNGKHYVYGIGGYDGTNVLDLDGETVTAYDLATVVNNKAEKSDITPQIQSDWNQNDATAKDYIKNKPFYEDIILEDYSESDAIKIQLKYLSTIKIVVSDISDGILPTMILDSSNNYTARVNGADQYYYANLNIETLVLTIQESKFPQLNIISLSQIKQLDEQYIPDTIARKESVEELREETTALWENLDHGTFPNLVSGDLAGRGESVPAEFGFRASGGKSIKDGRAYIKRIKGNSVVWNQQSSGESLGGDNGTTKALPQGARIVQGHKYLILCDKVVNSELYLYYNDGEGKSLTYLKAVSYKFIESSISFTANGQANTEGGMWWYLTNASANDARPRLIDLTQMFGAGNEPTTIEEYEARKPIVEDEYAYNEGQVIHCNTESIKSVGDNAWDEEVEIGSISSNSGENIPNDNALRPKNYIKILPNEQYHINVPFNEHIIFYDERKQFLSTLWQGSVKTFTTPSNAAYMRFRFNSTYGTTYNHDICIRLAHTGYKTDYEPYWQDILPLPIIRKYFPDGMKKAGTAHDEIRFNKASGKWEAVKRIGSVDMGDMAWSLYGSGFSSESLEHLAKAPTTAGSPSPIICGKYSTKNAGHSTSWADTDKVCYMSYDGRGVVYVNDSSYTDAATFKADMAGVMLYYELAEPIVTELDAEDQNFRDYYNVADFGTEEAIPAKDAEGNIIPSANFSADIIYQFNAVDMIREHELEITELQKVIATMQTQLASLIN